MAAASYIRRGFARLPAHPLSERLAHPRRRRPAWARPTAALCPELLVVKLARAEYPIRELKRRTMAHSVHGYLWRSEHAHVRVSLPSLRSVDRTDHARQRV